MMGVDALFTNRIPAGAFILGHFPARTFEEIRLSPTALPLINHRTLFETVRTSDDAFPLDSASRKRFLETHRPGKNALIASAGLVSANEEELDTLRSRIASLPKDSGPWFLTANAFENETESVAHGLSLADVGETPENFDFGLLASQPRHFNTLSFDGHSVKKVSAWKEKLQAEVSFFNCVPSIVEDFFPRLLSNDTDLEECSYTIEQRHAFDLGRLSVQNALGESDWKRITELLIGYFDRCPIRKVTAEEYRGLLTSLFLDKLNQRLGVFKELALSSQMGALFEAKTGRTFETATRELRTRLKMSIGKTEHTSLTFSHGDLCLSNILFDKLTQKLWFIDPRGVPEGTEPYLPPEYDLAKLSHSLLGHYEFTLADVDSMQPWCTHAQAMMERLALESQRKIADIRLFEASLFWSMLPLHAERPDRVFQFMIAGDAALRSSP
jgi:hypothetical protein